MLLMRQGWCRFPCWALIRLLNRRCCAGSEQLLVLPSKQEEVKRVCARTCTWDEVHSHLPSRAPASPHTWTPSSRTWLGSIVPSGACSRTVGAELFHHASVSWSENVSLTECGALELHFIPTKHYSSSRNYRCDDNYTAVAALSSLISNFSQDSFCFPLLIAVNNHKASSACKTRHLEFPHVLNQLCCFRRITIIEDSMSRLCAALPLKCSTPFTLNGFALFPPLSFIQSWFSLYRPKHTTPHMHNSTGSGSNRPHSSALGCYVLLFLPLDGWEEALILNCRFLFKLQEIAIVIAEQFLHVSRATNTTRWPPLVNECIRLCDNNCSPKDAMSNILQSLFTEWPPVCKFRGVSSCEVVK